MPRFEDGPCASEPAPDYKAIELAVILALSEDNTPEDDGWLDENIVENEGEDIADEYASNMPCDTFGELACTIACKRFCECHPAPPAAPFTENERNGATCKTCGIGRKADEGCATSVSTCNICEAHEYWVEDDDQ